ncbi:MAG: hypothetical protein IMY88_05225 [Chloroflexi bacterium]|nr:hypothetical protein [Chloroflexota bacterium]
MGLFIVEFDLGGRSPTTVENGDVIVDNGYSTITVRDVEADSTDDAINKARPKADAFLNELSWRYELNLEIGSSLTVMIQDSPETRHIKQHCLKVYTKGGHRKKYPRMLKEVVVKASDSKAYYRKAAMSQDPFDKFRNLYLTIENVASKIAATKGRDKCRDSELIEIALKECFSSQVQSVKEHKEVATLLFKGLRCQLNHAKASEDKKIPFNPDDEREVEKSLPLAESVAKSLLSYEDAYLLS